MNNNFLESIGIHSEDDLTVILEQLEEKQLEYFERLENVSDSKREEELRQILANIEKETESVKEELNAVKTAIIIDAPDSDKKEKKNQKSQAQKGKSEALKKDIEKLKSRAQRKPEKKAEENKTVDQGTQVKSNPANAQGDNSTSETRKDGASVKKTAEKKPEKTGEQSQLSRALQNYQKGEFKIAFKQFTDLGENKKDPVGQLMLARMYEKGEGTDANIDRALFWYKSAADRGNPDAQYAYAVHMLAKANGSADTANKKVGMSYMEKAAEQNYLEAIDRYVELSLQDGMNSHWLTKAMGYCDRAKNVVQGSYEKDQYERKKKELDQKRKSLSRAKNAGTVPTVLSVAGNLIYIVSFFYMFKGLHPYYTAEIKWFSKLPQVAEKYIIPWQKLREWAAADGFLSIYGIFAMELLAIAAVLTTVGAVGSRKRIAKKLGSIVPWVAVAMAIWHIYVWHTAPQYLLGFAVKSFIAFVVPIVAGCVIGSGVKSVCKIK